MLHFGTIVNIAYSHTQLSFVCYMVCPLCACVVLPGWPNNSCTVIILIKSATPTHRRHVYLCVPVKSSKFPRECAWWQKHRLVSCLSCSRLPCSAPHTAASSYSPSPPSLPANNNPQSETSPQTSSSVHPATVHSTHKQTSNHTHPTDPLAIFKCSLRRLWAFGRCKWKLTRQHHYRRCWWDR